MLWQGSLLAKPSSLTVCDSLFGCIIIYPIDITSEFDRKYGGLSQDLAFFELESV